MKKYYTRVCNFYYGNISVKLVNRKKTLPLNDNKKISFDKIEIISSKSEYKDKKIIKKKLSNNQIDIIFGTHAIFQKSIIFNKLGLIIIDEQHKFGVNQRKKLSDKGGDNCDVY